MRPREARYVREPSDIYDASEDVHGLGDDNEADELTTLNQPRERIGRSIDACPTYGSVAVNSIFSSETSILRRRAHNESQITQQNISSNGNGCIPSPINDDGESNCIETVIQEYSAACHIYGCSDRINAGILTTFRFKLPSLRVSGSFFDSDMLALVEVLLHHANGALSYIKRLDFTLAAVEGKQFGKKGIRSHGAYALSRVLQISKHIEEVFLPGNKIGPYGSAAIFNAARRNPTLRTLLMRGCRIGERGAFAFVSQILIPGEDDQMNCGLREIDLSVNQIGFYGVFEIEKRLKERSGKIEKSWMQKTNKGDKKEFERQLIEVDLEGNMVFQEVMNCVTHGLGILLAMIGTILLSNRVRGKPPHFVMSCAVYSVSLLVLYLSSTLYHSFFALQRTRYIFQVFDMCAIYILIAGSYTPFLSIALHHEPMWSGSLLAFIWFCGVSGIGVEALFPLWKHKPKFTLAMYLGMGWSCMVCMKDLLQSLPKEALYLLVAGGVSYTGGVPFFVRNNNLDHSIWHCFVLAGSMFHWFCIYCFVCTLDGNTMT